MNMYKNKCDNTNDISIAILATLCIIISQYVKNDIALMTGEKMDYISTKELAKRWGVSNSRILFLVKENRLPGAVKIGHSWVFPDNIEKPADMRSAKGTQQEESGNFHFPIYLFGGYSETNLEKDFTKAEAALYEAELSFHRGDIHNAYNSLSALLQTAVESTVRAGALYYVCRCCIALNKSREFRFFSESLKALCAQDIPYKQELELLLHDLDTYFEGNAYYTAEGSIDEAYRYHKSARNYLYLTAAYSAILAGLGNGNRVMTLPYEIICQQFEEERGSFSAQMLHSYLAVMYHLNGEPETGKKHLRKALLLVKETGYVDAELFFFHFLSDMFDSVFEESEFAPFRVIKRRSVRFYQNLQKFLNELGKTSPLVSLSEKDVEYIKYAMKGLSNKEIAELKGVSVSTVSKYYSSLYEMTGTCSRKELIELCSRMIQSYNISNS